MLESYFERLCTCTSLVRSVGKILPIVNHTLLCAGISFQHKVVYSWQMAGFCPTP